MKTFSFIPCVALIATCSAVDIKRDQRTISKDQPVATIRSLSSAVKNLTEKADSNKADDDTPLTHTMSFHQKLMVCNAYPGGPVNVRRNGVALKSKEPLPFNQCKYVDGRIYAEDRINFSFGEGVEGTFEVDELPRADSVLLLIVQKRDDSANDDLLAFQSFAFPANTADGNDAQVAFLNAVAGDDTTSLSMSDSYAKAGKGPREETVLFNRVYAIERGNYDVSLSDAQKNEQLQLESGQDYVVLKTGSKGHTQLMVFPPAAAGSLFTRFASLFYATGIAAPVVLALAAGSYYYNSRKAAAEL